MKGTVLNLDLLSRWRLVFVLQRKPKLKLNHILELNYIYSLTIREIDMKNALTIGFWGHISTESQSVGRLSEQVRVKYLLVTTRCSRFE